jgi:hypothetical protein
MLENEIREFIREALEEEDPLWWETCVSENIRKEVEQNRAREQDFANGASSADSYAALRLWAELWQLSAA